MKANDTKISIFLEGSKQFIVPLFQRTYSWKERDILQLWEDIENTKDTSDQAFHFFGSFVTMPLPSSASAVSRYQIIDGQQRLTTIYIFLAALRNRITEIQQDFEKNEEINELYLFNKFHPRNKQKLVPTQADRQLFFSILDGTWPGSDNHHLIVDSYNLLNRKLAEVDNIDELILLKNTLLFKFSVVDIRLEENDDPYLIFESLNATGTPLTQADLVRNYLFMKINPDKQQQIYDQIWFPMQKKLPDKLEQFIRHYLAMNGNIPNFNKIYVTFRNYANGVTEDEESAISIMTDLAKFAGYYQKLLYPENETEHKLKRAFEKLNRLEVTTSYPLLLKLYDDYENGTLLLDQFVNCIFYIEKFIVRRSVCGIPTNVLNKYFPTIYNSLNKKDIFEDFKAKLKNETGARQMPSDGDFKKSLKERKLYGKGILEYLLESIESYENKEVVIGMKRAIFKIGNKIEINSSTDDEAFTVDIDVKKWEKTFDDWDFQLEPKKVSETAGTSISISDLNENVQIEFKDKVFENNLNKIIARDYSFFLQSGFNIIANDQVIKPYEFKLRESKEFKPFKIRYKDDIRKNVIVRVTAGMAAPPPEDSSAEVPVRPEVDYYGWFVACNNRIVLAGDKSRKTGWGHDGFQNWHPQYNGFMGLIEFFSENPNSLPWTTTKRDLDVTDNVYRRALGRMKECTKNFIQYTNIRKENLEDAKKFEGQTEYKKVSDIEESEIMVTPPIVERPKIQYGTIQYQKPLEEIRQVGESLGRKTMAYKDVGIKTFDYYKENEVDE
jgi:uncharacterized protein with ParB-like and HNH nuclease domain